MTSKSWAMVLGVLSSIFLVHSQPQHLSLSKLHLSALACSFFFYFYDISFIIIWAPGVDASRPCVITPIFNRR